MRYCPFCGAEVDKIMAFCPSCGRKLQAVQMSGEPKASIQEETSHLNDADKGQFDGITVHSSKHVKSRRLGLVALGVISFIVVAIVLWSAFGKGRFKDNTRKIAKATESVVLVNTYDNFGHLTATGSGFVLFDESTIITNYHVIDSGLAVSISTDEDHTYSIDSVLAYSVERDVAILKTAEPTGLRCLKAGNSKGLKKGEDVVAIGSPLGQKNTVSTGVLSGRWYNDVSGVDELQFTAPISQGSSGGALFNNGGEVVGITSATLSNGQNLNLAIPIEEVIALYKEAGQSLTLKDIFVEQYGKPASYYLESQYIDFQDLLDHPNRYKQDLITSYAFVLCMLDENGDKKAFAVKTDADTDVLINMTERQFVECDLGAYAKSFEIGQQGYITFSGRFDLQEGGYYKDVAVVSRDGLTISKREKVSNPDQADYYVPDKYRLSVLYMG